ncbi:DUF3466 family protein [Neptunicella sp. SCSIO 80796]|uniref:DUF3466 family protein n=1 Tax=Neptunicella plasticusilytica TaxID=3117012 RepID=UPI003A4E3563
MKKTNMAAILSSWLLMVSNAHSAQYRVVELPVTELGESTYPSAMNSAGEITVNVQSQYNPQIDIDLLDFSSTALTNNLTDVEAAESGDFSDSDYQYLYSYIVSNAENQLFQQIASLNSYVATDSGSEIIHGFDTINADTGAYNNSATTQVRGINDFGYSVGISQDGFYKVNYTTEAVEDLTYVVNDFYARGFVKMDGEVIELAPPDTAGGGLSDAYDINNNNQIVGIGTTELATDTFQTSINACEDPDERGDIPLESCLRTLNITLNSTVSSLFQRRGIIWQVDSKGNITDTYTLGMLITPDESDTTIYTSSAVAINDYGVAVGQSPAFYQDSTSLTTAAAIYLNNKVLTINQDDEDEVNVMLSSTATDINNDNIVVGYATRSIAGTARTKFFVHDVDADLTTYPDDFFASSSSVATAVNNQGMVVGYGESEVSTGERRSEGFLYDYKNDIFNGLNTLIACDSPYTIRQANAINDNNEIAATAIVRRAQKDIKGEDIVDSNGATTEVDYIVAVKLVPIAGGSIDNCDESGTYVTRQGGSLGWILIILVLGGCITRVEDLNIFVADRFRRWS